MGKGSRRNRARAKQRSDRAAVPASVDDLPDELLDRVLLGLDSPLDLIRAAAACRRWRRAVADDGFLGRSYALHGAPRVAGHYYVTDMLDPHAAGRWRWPPENPAGFVPAATTSSRAVVDGRLFSLDFFYAPPAAGDPPRYMSYRSARIVRHNRCREIIDSRGSLLLLSNTPWWRSIDPRYWSPDFIVCQPVTRRFQGITRPADLGHLPFLGAFLIDSGGGGGGDAMSNFRLLSVLYERNPYHFQYGVPPPRPSGRPRACVFAPGSDGGWTMCWDATDDDDGVDVPSEAMMIHLAGRAAGRIFWGTNAGDMLVLDESTLKFSLLTFPPAHMRWPYGRTSFRVIGGGVDGAGAVRVVRMGRYDLEVFGRPPGSDQWVMEMSVGLSEATAGLPGWDHRFFSLPASIVTAVNSVVVLTPVEKTWLFSVDLETMEVESEHERNRHEGPSYPCTLPWPPVLRACVDHAGIVGKRRQRCKG